MVASFSGSSISSPPEWVDQCSPAAAQSTEHLDGFGLEGPLGQGAQRRGRDFAAATVIRHASHQAQPVLPLAVSVIKPSLVASLMPAVRRSPLLPPRLLPAPLGAVALPPIARAAQVEHRPARLAPALTLSEKDLLAGRHRPRKAGLDNRPPSWEAHCACCAASLAGVTQKPRSSAKTTGVSFLRLPTESLQPHARRAFGADDEPSLPRQQENRTSRRAPTPWSTLIVMRPLSMSVIKRRVTSLTRMPVAYAVSKSARSRSDTAAARSRDTSSSFITTGSRRGGFW